MTSENSSSELREQLREGIFEIVAESKKIGTYMSMSERDEVVDQVKLVVAAYKKYTEGSFHFFSNKWSMIIGLESEQWNNYYYLIDHWKAYW